MANWENGRRDRQTETMYTTHLQASPGNRRRQPLPPCNYTLLSADPEGVTWAPDAHGVMAPVSHAGCRLRAFEEAEVSGGGMAEGMLLVESS